jgi:hypothetical protein
VKRADVPALVAALLLLLACWGATLCLERLR